MFLNGVPDVSPQIRTSEPELGRTEMFLNGQFLNNVLIEMTILSLHEAQAANGQFSNNVLIENDHSEPTRGAGSERSIFKQCSY